MYAISGVVHERLDFGKSWKSCCMQENLVENLTRTEMFNSTWACLLCTEDDNSCYRNVCKMSVVSFALAVVFIIRHVEFPE